MRRLNTEAYSSYGGRRPLKLIPRGYEPMIRCAMSYKQWYLLCEINARFNTVQERIPLLHTIIVYRYFTNTGSLLHFLLYQEHNVDRNGDWLFHPVNWSFQFLQNADHKCLHCVCCHSNTGRGPSREICTALPQHREINRPQDRPRIYLYITKNKNHSLT